MPLPTMERPNGAIIDQAPVAPTDAMPVAVEQAPAAQPVPEQAPAAMTVAEQEAAVDAMLATVTTEQLLNREVPPMVEQLYLGRLVKKHPDLQAPLQYAQGVAIVRSTGNTNQRELAARNLIKIFDNAFGTAESKPAYEVADNEGNPSVITNEERILYMRALAEIATSEEKVPREQTEQMIASIAMNEQAEAAAAQAQVKETQTEEAELAALDAALAAEEQKAAAASAQELAPRPQPVAEVEPEQVAQPGPVVATVPTPKSVRAEKADHSSEAIDFDKLRLSVGTAEQAVKGDDALIVDKELKFYGVYDGVGGATGASDQVAEYAARVNREAWAVLGNQLGGNQDFKTIANAQEAMKNVLGTVRYHTAKLASEMVNVKGVEVPRGGASTLSSVKIINIDGKAYAAITNVGDSMVYRESADNRGHLEPLTKEQGGKQTYTRFDGKTYKIDTPPNEVHNTIGEGEEELSHRDDLELVPVRKGDRFVLFTDGVIGDWKNERLQPEDIATGLSGKTPQEIANLFLSVRRKVRDDASIVVVEAGVEADASAEAAPVAPQEDTRDYGGPFQGTTAQKMQNAIVATRPERKQNAPKKGIFAGARESYKNGLSQGARKVARLATDAVRNRAR